MVSIGLMGSSASATQGPLNKYCGAGNGGVYSVWFNSSTKQAGTAHSTGLVCSNYGVNAHYTVPTTGSSYWYGYTWDTYSAVQSPGYVVDKAEHDTGASSPVTTY